MQKNSFIYINENDFNKKLRSLKKYVPTAYKDLIFGDVKEKIQSTINDGYYSIKLKASKEFEFVYGEIKLIYSVKDNVITMLNIEPSQFLLDGYNSMLETYKGICYRNQRDMFKINLLMSLKERNCAI